WRICQLGWRRELVVSRILCPLPPECPTGHHGMEWGGRPLECQREPEDAERDFSRPTVGEGPGLVAVGSCRSDELPQRGKPETQAFCRLWRGIAPGMNVRRDPTVLF